MSVLQWVTQQPTFNTSLDDTYPSIAVDSTGNSYISYQTSGRLPGQTRSGGTDVVVLKLDTFGAVSWISQEVMANTLGGDTNTSIALDSAGNSYIAFQSSDTTWDGNRTGADDIVVFKLSPSGVFVWAKQQPTFNTTAFDTYPSIAVDSAGNSYVAYGTYGTVQGQTRTGSSDIVVFKLDKDGIFLWARQQPDFNTNSYNLRPSIAVDRTTGNLHVAYQTNGTSLGQTLSGPDDIVVFKLSPTGTTIWVKQQPTFNTVADDTAPSIGIDSSGNSYIAYQSNGNASSQTLSGSSDIVVFKLSPTGATLWVKQQPTFNTSANDLTPSIAVDSAGNSYVACVTNGSFPGQTNAGLYDIAVFKLDAAGNVSGVTQLPAFNTTSDNWYPSIAVNSAGYPYIAYRTIGTVPGQTSANLGDIVVFKLAPNLCVGGDTLITLADGGTKKIQNIRRGDQVINLDGKLYKVCRVCRETIDSRSLIDLVVISPDSFGFGQPKQQLIVTPNHPIFYQGCRRPAKCFQNFPGVELFNKVVAGNFLGENGQPVFLYDLQFETDGSYIANGVEVQSRCPYSDLDPLPKELYYDESLYMTELVWDSYNHTLPLDMNIL